jgi:hypothetical protein
MREVEHAYEVRPCKDHRGVDLISDALPFGRLGYGKVDNAIGYAQHYSRSHHAVIRVYRTCLLLIFCQSHILSRKACGVGVCLARYYIQLCLRQLDIV